MVRSSYHAALVEGFATDKGTQSDNLEEEQMTDLGYQMGTELKDS